VPRLEVAHGTPLSTLGGAQHAINLACLVAGIGPIARGGRLIAGFEILSQEKIPALRRSNDLRAKRISG